MYSSHQNTILNFSISLGETYIIPSDIVNLLGLIIDDRLSFGHHVKKIIHKANLKLTALRHQSKWLDQDIRLEYGSQSGVLALAWIQKCMLRVVLEDYELSYEDKHV